MNIPPSMGQTSAPSPGQTIGMRIPLHKPRWTFVLLGINVAVYVLLVLFGVLNGLGVGMEQDTRVLLLFGAQQNNLVAQGGFYRLLTSMFLHASIIHLVFNSYALYVVGQDVERLYGAGRFLVIYFLGGLGGSLLTYVLGGPNPSVGASGAIFGLIGAEIAFFYLHRKTFGPHGQQQLRNLLMVAGINLFLGFSIAQINNLAHIGGLVFGAALGFLLAPQYEAPSVFMQAGDGSVTLQDSNSIGRRLPMLLVVTIVLAAMALIGTTKWGG